MYATSVQSQIKSIFHLQPNILELGAILSQVHQMTPKWPWKLQGEIYIYICLFRSEIYNTTLSSHHISYSYL